MPGPRKVRQHCLHPNPVRDGVPASQRLREAAGQQPFPRQRHTTRNTSGAKLRIAKCCQCQIAETISSMQRKYPRKGYARDATRPIKNLAISQSGFLEAFAIWQSEAGGSCLPLLHQGLRSLSPRDAGRRESTGCLHMIRWQTVVEFCGIQALPSLRPRRKRWKRVRQPQPVPPGQWITTRRRRPSTSKIERQPTATHRS